MPDPSGLSPHRYEGYGKCRIPSFRHQYPPWDVAHQDAGDVVQEVFATVVSHLGRFTRERSGDTFRGWLWTIARNKARDYFRRRADEPAPAQGTEPARKMQQLAAPNLRDHSAKLPTTHGFMPCFARRATRFEVNFRRVRRKRFGLRLSKVGRPRTPARTST